MRHSQELRTCLGSVTVWMEQLVMHSVLEVTNNPENPGHTHQLLIGRLDRCIQSHTEDVAHDQSSEVWLRENLLQ